MSAIYSHFSYYRDGDSQNYTVGAGPQKQTGGTEYSFDFSTDATSIPACNCKTYASKSNFINYGIISDNAKGFIVSLTDNGDLLFANEEAIQLPANQGDAIEGVLNLIDWSSSSIPDSGSSET